MIEEIEFVYYEEFEKKKSRKIKISNDDITTYGAIKCSLEDESALDENIFQLIEFLTKNYIPMKKIN